MFFTMLLIVLLECFSKFSVCTLKYFTIQRIILEQQSSCGNITVLALTLNKDDLQWNIN